MKTKTIKYPERKQKMEIRNLETIQIQIQISNPISNTNTRVIHS
jgi:hypothetical protein